MNTESLLEANKDDATKALEIAITKANQELYHDAFKFARKAQRMNPKLDKIRKLVASMEILSASSDTTHYKLLGVEETDNATKIRSAYRKLAIDVHPDQNPFPKASEAFKRIVLASSVLSDEQSRAKFDHALAAARKTARNAAAREAAEHEAAARESAAREAAAREAATRAAAAREAAAREAAACQAAARESAAREATARESAAREAAAREAAARQAAREADVLSGESFSTDSSSTDTSYTDASSTDDLSSDDSFINASSTDDVGPRSKRASDAQSTSTLHTAKKRRE